MSRTTSGLKLIGECYCLCRCVSVCHVCAHTQLTRRQTGDRATVVIATGLQGGGAAWPTTVTIAEVEETLPKEAFEAAVGGIYSTRYACFESRLVDTLFLTVCSDCDCHRLAQTPC